MDACVAFVKSLSSVPPKSSLSTANLTKFIEAKVLTNFTFALISERQFLIIFCYTELLFPRHSESDRTHTHLLE